MTNCTFAVLFLIDSKKWLDWGARLMQSLTGSFGNKGSREENMN